MFKRAAAYVNLSPGERAFLRLIEGLLIAAFIAGLQAAMPLLNSGVDPMAVPWGSVAQTFAATVLGAIGAAVLKYAKAQGDPPLPPPPPPVSGALAASAVPLVPLVPSVPAVPAAPTVPPIVAPIAAEASQP